MIKENIVMNSRLIFLAAMVAAGAAVSCVRTDDFQTTSFAAFNSGSGSCSEDAGTVSIPVTIYPNGGNGSTEVSFTVTDGTAKQGANFTVTPANGILTFAEGETVKNITLNVVNREGIFDGNLKFTVTLTGATNDFVVSGVTSYEFTIADLDHPLSAILGTWTGKATDYWGSTYSFNWQIEAVEDDATYTKVTVKDVCPYLASYYTHTFDATVDENFTIFIKAEQWIYTGYYYMECFTADMSDYAENLEMAYDADAGTLTNQNYFGARGSSGWYELYVPGAVVLSKN